MNSNKINSKRSILKYLIVKMLKPKHNKRKTLITFKESSIKLTADFLSATMEPSRQ